MDRSRGRSSYPFGGPEHLPGARRRSAGTSSSTRAPRRAWHGGTHVIPRLATRGRFVLATALLFLIVGAVHGSPSAGRARGRHPRGAARALPDVLPDGDLAPPQEDRAIVVGASRRSTRRGARGGSAVSAPPRVSQPREPATAHPVDSHPRRLGARGRRAPERDGQPRPASRGHDHGAPAGGGLPRATWSRADVR